eukprot:1145380-Pelagomonas_calceolata.AAC.8
MPCTKLRCRGVFSHWTTLCASVRGYSARADKTTELFFPEKNTYGFSRPGAIPASTQVHDQGWVKRVPQSGKEGHRDYFLAFLSLC